MLILDNFDGGDFERVFNQTGIYGGIVQGIDPRDTVGGSRQYALDLGNPLQTDVSLNNRDGRLEVSWTRTSPNVTSVLDLDYGAGVPMRVDIGFATAIQIDRSTDPDLINAHGYTFFLRDSQFRSVNSNAARQRPQNGIEFFRADFRGDSDFDWSDVVFMRFRQRYENTVGQLSAYRTLEIRAVPEPSSAVWLSVSFSATVLLARRRRARRQPAPLTESRR